MAKTANKGFTRIELWIPNSTAKYASQVAGHYGTKRKLYLEEMVNDHLAIKCKTIRPITQATLALIEKTLKASNGAKKKKK